MVVGGEPNATGGPAPRCRPSRKARSTAGCEGWRPTSRRGGWGRLSRPGLRPSSPRALPAPIVRGRSEAFPLPIARRNRDVRPRSRETGSVREGSAPVRLGGRRTLGSVVPGSVVVVGPVVPGSLVAIARVIPRLRGSAAPAAGGAGGSSGAAVCRGAGARGPVAAGGRCRPCGRTRRAQPAMRPGRRTGDRRGGGGGHDRGAVVPP